MYRILNSEVIRMLSTIKTRNHMIPSGRVLLEYVSKDGTCRSKMSKNLAFTSAWNENYVIESFLRNNASLPYLILTDYSGEVNPSLPLIPGNVVGYAQIGYGSSGLYQGAEIVSSREQSVANNGVITDKRVFEFTGSQVPGKVKTIGYSRQWNGVEPSLASSYGFTGYKLINSPPEAPLISDLRGIINQVTGKSVMLYNASFSKPSTVTLQVQTASFYDTSTTMKTISANISESLTHASFWQKALALDVDTGKYYFIIEIYSRPSSTTNVYRYIFEISDDFSSMSVYDSFLVYSGTSEYPYAECYNNFMYPYAYNLRIQSVGYKKGDKYYFGTNENSKDYGVYEANLQARHTDGKTQLDFSRFIPLQWPFGTEKQKNGYTATMFYGDSLVAFMYDSSFAFGFLNLNNVDAPAGSTKSTKTSNCDTLNLKIFNSADGNSELIAYLANNNSNFTIFNKYVSSTIGALTWFRVPDDAPERGEGDGIRITYELTFTPA